MSNTNTNAVQQVAPIVYRCDGCGVAHRTAPAAVAGRSEDDRLFQFCRLCDQRRNEHRARLERRREALADELDRAQTAAFDVGALKRSPWYIDRATLLRATDRDIALCGE